MPTFVYKAKRGPQEVVEGEVVAPDEAHTIKILDGLGLVPVTIRLKQDLPAVESKEVRKAPPSPTGLKRRHVNEFVRSLANLVKGNVPILKALSLLEKQSPAGMTGVAGDLVNAVRQGASLSSAMERHPNVFPRLLIGMVRGGESAGLLGEMLDKTADHEEKAEELRRRIRGAMAYPLFVFAMGAATIVILLVYFMPRLTETYLSNQQNLPWPTEAVLAVSGFLSSSWYWIVGVFFLVFAVTRKRGGGSHGPWDMIKLQLPFIKSLALKSSVVSFSRTLSLLLSNGVPVVKGVPLAAETVANHVVRNRLKAIQELLVKRGSSLGAALREVSGFPPQALALVSVGEESGNLAVALGHVADQFERDVEQGLKTSTTLIEPVMILLVGGVIGFVVFAMLMPIFQMDVMVQ